MRNNPRRSACADRLQLFQCCATDTFQEDIRKLDRHLRKRIDTAIFEELAKDPYKSKRVAAQEHRGKRIFRVGDYRIIFTICEECRKLGFKIVMKCLDCKKHGIDHIILFSVSHRSIAYEEF